MENFAFTISLNDLMSAPSKRIQSALIGQQKELLKSAKDVVSLEKSIGTLSTAMKRSAALGDVGAYQKQSRQLGMLKVALDQADKSELNLARDLGKRIHAMGESIERTNQMTEVAALAGEGLLKIGEFIGEATKKAIEFTIEQVEMKAKLISTLDALGKGPGAGAKTFAMLDELSDKLPQTRDQLAEWSKTYMAMGMTDLGQLRNQLHATASAQALMGDAGSEAFTKLSQKIEGAVISGGKLKLADKQLAALAKTGVNVADVATKMGMSVEKLRAGLAHGSVNAKAFGDAVNAALISKGAGPLDKMGMSLSTLSDKFKENIGKLFEDVDIEPFLSAMKSLLDDFSQGTSTGKTLKSVLGGMFTGIFSIMGKVIRQSNLLFLGMMILGLRAYIAIKPFIPAIKMVGTVLLAAGAAFAATFIPALVAGAAAGVVALGSLIAAAVVAAAPFILIGAAIAGAGFLIYKFWDQIKAFGSAAAGIAGDIVSGLAGGIMNGTGAVIDAIKSLGHAALDKLKNVFDSHSPSRAFAKLGMFGGMGLAEGFRSSSLTVNHAVERMGGAALESGAKAISPTQFRPQQPTPAAAASSDGAKTTTIHLHGGIHIEGAGKDANEITEHAVSLVFERIALEQGL